MTRDGLFHNLEIVLAAEAIFLLAVMVLQPVRHSQTFRPVGPVAPVIHAMARVRAC